MIPVIAIVGRPNVGKSTLFNCLTKSRDALVADLPGVTRDRKYGEGEQEGQPYIVIDTGGLEPIPESELFRLMSHQAIQAIQEADAILFIVDGKEGLTVPDERIADIVRRSKKPVFLVVNKTENMSEEIAKSDFYQIGFATINVIASAHNRGINKLVSDVLATFEQATSFEETSKTEGIKIAVVGRPNVGKSTLINRILGEERVLVYDQPGTTRDSIFIPFVHKNQSYTLIDTAGVRRRTKVVEGLEKFSVIKTLQAIEASNVVIFIFDAKGGISEQDLRLLDFVLEAGKALVVAVNKWDNLPAEEGIQIKNEIDRRLEFVSFARLHFISALYGTGVGNLFRSILEAYQSATKKIATPLLTRILQEAVTQHQPPLIKGRRIKLRYAHTGGHNPPLFVIHGNQTENLPLDYIRYLKNSFRKRLKLTGTPIRIEFRSSENPFKNKKTLLTPRQRQKRKRLMRYVKSKK
jgi:GTPase